MSGFTPLVLELDPPPDPLDCCTRCRDLPFLIFLDSAATSDRLGRHSFLSGDPAVVVRSKGERTERWTSAAGTWPKIRAMQIIAELEPTQRGVYCGSIGYLSVTGALDTSIVIRTYLVLGEDVYFLVGGGIVADSDPEQEYRETLDKERGLIAALGAT